MKVLVISSGNSGNIGTLVKNQCESLKEAGIEIENFLIKGKGFFGYIRNIPGIRKAYFNSNADIVHAHYSFSALAAGLAGNFPLIVSLMGSDTYMSGVLRLITRLFCKLRWDAVIVKTQRMKDLIRIDSAMVIPNGVNLELFRPISENLAKEKIGYSGENKLILFLADPTRAEKNFTLARRSVDALNRKDVELIPVYDIDNKKIPYFMNAADLLLLTSRYEGSVNVVKEAMACNLPIVSTDVGDVKWVIENVEGCFITSFDYRDIAEKLDDVLMSGIRTEGRERIIELGLDSESVAAKIIQVYFNIQESSKKQKSR